MFRTETTAPDPSPDGTDPLTAPRGRLLLSKLRDLDLRAARVALTPEVSIRVEGCLSSDEPIEPSVRYRLVRSDGSQLDLDLAWRDGALDLALREGERVLGARRLTLVCDGNGRASAPAIRARVDPDTSQAREVEHFLRRLIRATCAGSA